MTRRRLPAVLALFGLLLLAFLGWLARAFSQGDAQARGLVEARARAVAQAGRALALEAVRSQQRRAQAQVLALEKNPLLDDAALLFAIDGVQRLPVPFGPDSAARNLSQRLEALALVVPGQRGAGEGDGAFAAQVEVLRALRDALAKGRPAEARLQLERLLGAERRRGLTLQEDAALVVSALESWPEGAPLPLAEAALRGAEPRAAARAPTAEPDRAGDAEKAAAQPPSAAEQPEPHGVNSVAVPSGPAPGLGGTLSREPLQRAVLRLRAKLSFDEYALLCERLAGLGRKFELAQEDFLARCRTVHEVPQVPAAPLRAPAVVRVGEVLWLLEADENATLGVPIALEALEVSTQAQLARVGLLQPGEALRLRLGEAFAPGDPADAVSPSGEVPLFARFESKALAQQLEQLEEARRLKQLLLVVCAALALGLALGAVQQQRARQRFLQARADFLAAVSHELKTPLAAVRVMAETLALRLEGTAAAKDYPQRIVQEADGLSALVENLLSFERIDKGRWVLQRRKVEVAGWAAALHDEVARAGKAVHLQLEGFEGLTAELDGALVQLLLVNLVRNACRYTARTPAEVRVSAAREGQEVVFRVRDNGVGIPPEAQRRIFEPFVRLEPAASSGSGLGLALALRIAQLHGGTLAVEASSHEGSTFVARLVG